MFYILLGQDAFSIHQALEEIKRVLGDAALVVTNTTTLEAPVRIEQLKAACETAPFLSAKRLVVVNGLFEHFEPANLPRRQKKSEDNGRQKEIQELAAYLGKVPASTVLVLVDGAIKGNNPLLREVSAKATVRTFPPLKDTKLLQWIQKRVKDEGSTISAPAMELLARLVGADLWTMASEISKLARFALGRPIEEEDVREVVSSAREASVFAMVDAIFDFKAGLAEQLLQRLLQRGAAPPYLLSMITRQLRLIVRAKELKSQGKSKPQIQEQLGLSSEYALNRVLEQIDRYTFERIQYVYRKLLEADLAIKTGKYEGELALNILVAELCQRARPTPA